VLATEAFISPGTLLVPRDTSAYPASYGHAFSAKLVLLKVY